MPRSSRSVLRAVLMVCLMAPASACVELDFTGLHLAGDCLLDCGYAWPVPVIPFESRPTPVAGGLTFTSISVGSAHVCGVTSTGGYCWGNDGTVAGVRTAPSPEATPGTDGFVQIRAAQGFTCGVTQDGRALCWGFNGGQLGNGEVGPPSGIPSPVQGALSFTTVSAAGAVLAFAPHACGLTAAGAAYCWGGNSWGQLGNGGTIASPTPVAVAGGHIFESISVGSQFTCGIVRERGAYCWGQATAGQLGDDPRDAADNCAPAGSVAILPCNMTPVRVPGGGSFTTISAGGNYACGLDAEGVAYCWGNNLDGQLGTGSHFWTDTPARVSSSMRFTAIAAGTGSTCALTRGREVLCWGSNHLGQLGDGTTTPTLAPVKVMSDLSFTAISVGNDEACALTPDGAAYCWGSNEYGKLGKGS
jgi:alpha-tubulin suppressor-like RCC1 family protein